MPSATGDRAEYEGWVRDHAADLYRFAYRLTSRRDLAEELLQETFLEAWKNRGALRDDAVARAWLFSILRHRYSHQRRYRSSRPDMSATLCDLNETPSRPLAGKPADSAGACGPDRLADRDALQAGLEMLDERERVPFVMVFVQGLTCREAAAALSVPTGTILSRLSRARITLRRRLGSLYPQLANRSRDCLNSTP